MPKRILSNSSSSDNSDEDTEIKSSTGEGKVYRCGDYVGGGMMKCTYVTNSNKNKRAKRTDLSEDEKNALRTFKDRIARALKKWFKDSSKDSLENFSLSENKRRD